MKTISITKGKTVFVDDEDYEELIKRRWFANKGKNGNFYAARRMSIGKSKSKIVLMHRVILGVTDNNIKIDHIDHNGLNNQKSNLRICTNAENSKNKTSKIGSSSKYLGVSYDKEKQKWFACIQLNGKTKYLGRFNEEEMAAKAYDEAAKENHGEFANLNFK